MKMKIAWKPESADRQEWVVDRDNPAWDVAYATEKATDWGWIEFVRRFDGISPAAWRALLWALRKREETRLRLEWVEIDWNEIAWSVQCGRCEEWIPVRDLSETHECTFPDPEPAADAVGESAAPDDVSPDGAGDPDPEA